MRVCLLLLVACGAAPKGEDGCAPSDAPSVELGVGELGFGAMPEDGQVSLVRGPQGGVHLPLAVRVRGMNSEETAFSVLLGKIAGEEAAHGSPYVTLRCNPESDALEAWDLRMVYDGAAYGELDGVASDVTLTLTDADGREVEASASVTLND